MARYLNTLSQAGNKNGKAISGATLTFTETGTGTFLDTFQDEALTIDNKNPVVADGQGRFPDIWLQAQKYRVVFKDEGGTVLDTHEDVTGPIISGADTLETIAAMTALLKSSLLNGVVFEVDGYFSSGDGGGGRFKWDSTSTATANGGTIIITDEGGTGRWLRIVNTVLNGNMFGSGLGQADDTVAMQAFVTALGAGAGRLPAGTHIQTAEITGTQSADIYGDGDATIIDQTDVSFTGTSGFDFSGAAPVQIEELGANATVGDSTVTFASAPSLSVGDPFFIFNPTLSSWSGFRTSHHAGEWCEVASISGSVVTLKTRLYDSYTIAAVDVYKPNLIAPTLRDMTIIGDVALNVARFEYCTGLLTSNLNITHSNNACISSSRCFDFTHENARVKNEGDGGDDYGISLGNSQKGTISNPTSFGRRHGVNIGGGEFIGAVPNRNIRIRGGTLENDQSLAVHCADFHGNCEDCSYEGVTIHGGVTFQGKRNGYKDCNIYARNDGVVASYAEIKGGLFYADNCNTYSFADPSTGSRGFFDVGGDSVAIDSNTTEDSTIRIKNIHHVALNSGNNTQLCKFVNRGTDQKVNFDIQNVHVEGLLGTFLSTDLSSGTADSDFIIVDDVYSSDTSVFLASHVGSDYLNFPHRMQVQSGKETIASTNTNIALGTLQTFKYIYPRIPVGVAGLSLTSGSPLNRINGQMPITNFELLTTTGATMQISTADTADTMATGTNLDAHFNVALNEI